MSQDNKAPSNIIQFPGRKKEEETPSQSTPQAQAPVAKPAKAAVAKAPKKSKKNIGASVLAIMLFTGAVNRYVYSGSESSTDLSSNGRAIASVDSISNLERMNFVRDADWEKQLAESLASSQVRDVASNAIGRSVTKEEKLRWGTLEEKYTITYGAKEHRINSILLQDASADPAYILDRTKFLNEYGALFEGSYASSKLKSVETSDDKTVESYMLFDKEKRPMGEARFELDRHKRLISLKVEPISI